MSTLSIVISAFNEEKRIDKCLESALFADEIIFVDNTSLDKTVQIAKKYTKKIYTRENNPMLNVNKNFGITKATGDWILSLDADEQIPKQLSLEIINAINTQGDINGYWIPRKNIIFDKWIENSIWWPDYQLRLFKKGEGKFAEKHVHEAITVSGRTEKLQEPLLHDNYSSISQYINKMNLIYTESEAENYINSGKQVFWFDAIRFPSSDFVKTFFAQKGYKDGLHGLVLSLLQAFYSEVVFAKIWEKQGFKEYTSKNFLGDCYKEMRKIANEMHYWFLTNKLNDTTSLVKKSVYKLQRKTLQRKLK